MLFQYGIPAAIVVIVLLLAIFGPNWLKARRAQKAEEEEQRREWAARDNRMWANRTLALGCSTARRMANADGEREAVAKYLEFLRKEDPNATETDVWSNARDAELATLLGR